ncbi:shikimate dehydrogenase [Paeniglutamicibacter sp. ABSL32-1]|uniref:shikimate dehydrogenase n=1 Tax=Paeniglutamicibacter quisquiliarum TaxID=2849498 RepID=UPI001C2D9790|nr:shikimate dehydrogenase [Paeniglutamicibacter quisquiliarum]MBV1777768.1 shikimate dehydrogenase [Paeniglutamicibacter quisquiliarum]
MTTHMRRIGLIGNDLGSSLSPAIHEAEASALGLTGFSYEAIDLAGIPEPNLGQVLATAITDGFTGFNVTHPHKQAIIPFLDAVAPDAAALGAVNTVVVENGRTVGHNTDRTGFLAGLRRSLPEGTGHHTVVLFGAGGAGSAVASALLDHGVVRLRIIDTDQGRREDLRRLLVRSLPDRSDRTIDVAGTDMAEAWVGEAQGVVNATPIGMEHIPGTPFDVSWLTASHWVADVIYRPVVTELLAAAEVLGSPVVKGTAMLIEQAADTFLLVTGLSPERGRMREQLAGLLVSVRP